MPFCVKVIARDSPLSRTQVEEILQQMHFFYPTLRFETTCIKSYGDVRHDISLRTQEKNDFFTKELDEALLCKKVRIAIHSAKDLPEVIHESFQIAAITKGIDSSDSIVFRNACSLEELPQGAKIGVSSKRREDALLILRQDLECIDIRGNIGERLDLLQQGKLDAIIVAEAALIRLQLTHLKRQKLLCETSPLQGKLAVVCLKEDKEMLGLFACIDTQVMV